MIELRDVTSVSELQERYRSARARLMPPRPKLQRQPPKPSIVEQPPAERSKSPASTLEKQLCQQMRHSVLDDDLSFEDKVALILSLIPRECRPSEAGRLSQRVMVVTANVFDITLAELLNQSQRPEYCRPRHIAMAICVDVLGLNFSRTGRLFKRRDHTSARAAQLKYGSLIDRLRYPQKEIES
jgi:chromosomal replication initiation ATPase DnaA